jgi:flavin-dependent dehydrogenase
MVTLDYNTSMTNPPLVAIMGCGPGGAYLYALLRDKKPELEAVVFDKTPRTVCGKKGCAWGAGWHQFARFSKEINVNPEKYVLGRYDRVLVNRIEFKADVVIINKPLFINDLLGGKSPLNPSDVDLSLFERIVDASGVSRAYLSSRQDLALVNAIQMRISNVSVACPRIFADKTGGYAWLFPLGKEEVHLGSLSPLGNHVATRAANRFRETLAAGKVLCSCSETICRSGPIRPFTEGKVWGLGEAIGLVDPLAGAGIVPAMHSAKLMSENWDNAQDYEKQIWRYYSYMAHEAKTIAKIVAGERLFFRDLSLPRRAFETLGVYPSFYQIVRLASKVIRTSGTKDD